MGAISHACEDRGAVKPVHPPDEVCRPEQYARTSGCAVINITPRDVGGGWVVAAIGRVDQRISRPLPGLGGEAPDYCCQPGAERLKAMIEAYWRERGFHVSVRVRQAGFHPSVRAIRFEVQSDMIDGLPRLHAATDFEA